MKLAIITSGGGMRCSFGAGALLALAEQHGIREPDILICASGSAGTASYYLAGQYDSIRTIWTHHLSSKRFINLARFSRIIDIDYLIDTVLAREEPLDIEALRRSRTHHLIAALNLKEGTVDYLDASKGNVYEIMRATKAMPIVYSMNPGVMINGIPYCDSPISTRSKTHLQRAVELGADTIITIDSDTKLRSTIVFDAWMLFQPCRTRYAHQQAHEYAIPSSVRHYTIKPEEKNPASLFTTDATLLERSLEHGYAQTAHDTQLERFLNPT